MGFFKVELAFALSAISALVICVVVSVQFIYVISVRLFTQMTIIISLNLT